MKPPVLFSSPQFFSVLLSSPQFSLVLLSTLQFSLVFTSVPLEFHKVSLAEWCCLAIVGSLYKYDTDISVVYATLSGILYYKYTLMMVPI